MLANNCVDFVQKAIEASGIKADFRDSFHTMQYWRRPGGANMLSMIRSKGPQVHGASAIPSSLVNAVDLFSRNTLKLAVATPLIALYGYTVKKSIPAFKAVTMRAGARIHQLSSYALGPLMAFGAFIHNRYATYR